MTSGRVFECRACGKECTAKNQVGRMPAYCDAHSPKTREDKRRENSRKKSRRAGKKRSDVSRLFDDAERLAVGLSRHPDDVETAALSAGVTGDKAGLKELESFAREHFTHIIAGDAGALGRECTSLIYEMLTAIRRNLDQISPRDLVNGVRNVATTRDLVAGNGQASQFATINLTVIGADGEAIKIGDE